MIYDVRNLQTNYTPVRVTNIPFLVLYAKNKVAAKIVRVYMPIFVGNPREDSHIIVKGLLVGIKIKPIKEDSVGVAQA